jgi:hypothetical protein
MIAGQPSTATVIYLLVSAAAMLAGGIVAGTGVGLLYFGRRSSTQASRKRAWTLTIVGLGIVVAANMAIWTSELLGV